MNEYCNILGKDREYVQGAGGNVSWKIDSKIWVKASGKWLSQALKENIYVEVNRDNALDNILKGDFDQPITTNDNSDLRPSIETIFHILMPHQVVIHLHAIKPLAILIQKNYKEIFRKLLKDHLSYEFIDYIKPGTELGKSIHFKLMSNNDIDVFFLQNHGIIIGGDSIKQADDILKLIISKVEEYLSNKSLDELIKKNNIAPKKLFINDKVLNLLDDNELNMIVFSDKLISHVKYSWAYAPDHVVFLGSKPFIYDSVDQIESCNEIPQLAFIKGLGIYVDESWNLSKYEQLICFYDVMKNATSNLTEINLLKPSQINELINWDSEQFRISQSK